MNLSLCRASWYFGNHLAQSCFHQLEDQDHESGFRSEVSCPLSGQRYSVKKQCASSSSPLFHQLLFTNFCCGIGVFNMNKALVQLFIHGLIDTGGSKPHNKKKHNFPNNTYRIWHYTEENLREPELSRLNDITITSGKIAFSYRRKQQTLIISVDSNSYRDSVCLCLRLSICSNLGLMSQIDRCYRQGDISSSQ